MNPGATEVANGRDDDGDGVTDEDTIYRDDDGDGYSEIDGDCDDTDPSVIGDCDGEIGVLTDMDGVGYATEDGDCDDTNGWMHPQAKEVCDDLDNDCDGEIDEECVELDGITVPDPQAGCGCASTGQSGSALWLLVGFLGVLRRRA
jgi:MYXO-CTERM domain-containing protein